MPSSNQEKIPDNEIIYCICFNVMTTTDCCISKMQIRLVVQYSKTQELIDLPSIFDVFKNQPKAMTKSPL